MKENVYPSYAYAQHTIKVLSNNDEGLLTQGMNVHEYTATRVAHIGHSFFESVICITATEGAMK